MVHRVHVIVCSEGRSQNYSNQRWRILRYSKVDGWQKYAVMGCASKLFPAIELEKLENSAIIIVRVNLNHSS